MCFCLCKYKKGLFKKQYFSNINFQGRVQGVDYGKKRIIVAAIDNDYGLAVSD